MTDGGTSREGSTTPVEAGTSFDASTSTENCGTLTNNAPATKFVTTSSAAAPAGGELVSGTYYQTSVTSYGGCLPAEVHPSNEDFGKRSTWVVHAVSPTSGTIRGAFTDPTSSIDLVDTISYTTNGTQIALDYFCPASLFGDTGTLAGPMYTATPTEIRLYYPDKTAGADGGLCSYTYFETFTKQ